MVNLFYIASRNYKICALFFLASACTTIPVHCRNWGDPRQCARDHPADEFFCDDTPHRDPKRCGLTSENSDLEPNNSAKFVNASDQALLTVRARSQLNERDGVE